MAYPIATLADGRILYSDGSKRTQSQDRQTYAPIGSSVKGPNYYLNSQGTLTHVDPNTGQVRQGIPNTPQSVDPRSYPSTQQQAAAIRAQDIESGGFTWSSREDYEKDRAKARSLGYNSPEEMRRAETQQRREASQRFSSTTTGSLPSFQTLLSSLNPVKPAYASELETVKPEDITRISNQQPGIITSPESSRMGNILNDLKASINAINPQSGLSFTDRIKSLVGGNIGNIGTSLNLPEFGISERLIGGINQTPKISKASSESSLGPLSSRASVAPNKSVAYQTPAGLSTQRENLNTNIKDYNQGIRDAAQDVGAIDPELGESFLLINDELEGNRQDLIRGIEEGRISEQEAALQWEKTQREKLEGVYRQLNEMALSKIPDIRAAGETAVERLNRNFDRFKETADPVISNIENTFGQAVRRAVENAQEAKTNLRNVYSSVGSAESSQFLDRLGNIERDTGRTTGAYELEKGNNLVNIQNRILDERTATTDKIEDINTQVEADIKKIMQDVDLNNLEKATKIGDLIENAQLAIQQANQTASSLRNQIDLTDRESLLNRQSLLQQGAIDRQLILDQSGLSNQLNSNIPYIPPEVDNEIRGFLATPQSGGTKYFKLLAYKDRYPELAQLIDQITGGKVNAQDYAGLSALSSTGLGF